MIPFSYRVFKDQLSRPLERAETQFMIKTFSGAALYFFLFGIALGNINLILEKVLGNTIFIRSVFALLGFLFSFVLHFFSMKYRNNPLRLPNSFIVTIFSLLTFCFMSCFLGLTGILNYFLEGSSISSINVWWMILFVFGTSFCIYLIPAFIALVISNRRTIISLNKFLNFCVFAYFALFVIIVFSAFFGYRLSSLPGILLFFIGALIVFCSPIVTIYKMKSIAPYINFDDQLERKRWEQYFIFEISLQLLQIAFYVMRTVIFFLSRSSNSRLR